MEYKAPTIKVVDIQSEGVICGSGNGNHKGWDNPHNPHYNGTDNIEDDEIF